MAIQFLNNLQFNQNEALKLRLENLATLPTTGNTIGRLAFKTGADSGVYVATSTGNNWINLSAGDIASVTSTTAAQITTTNPGGPDVTIAAVLGSVANGATNLCTSDVIFDAIDAIPGKNGTVTSVSQTHGGNAFTVGGSPITTAGTLAITMAGSAAQYINGAGNLITFPNIPAGVVTSITGGTYINVTGTAAVPIINHDLTSRTNTTTGDATIGFGGSFTMIDTVTSNTTGHVTATNLKTITLPANPNTNETYTLPVSAGGGNSANIDLTAGGAGSGIKSTVEFIGTTGRIAISETPGNNGNITIDMPDDVTIVDDLTIGGEFVASGTGTSSFAGPLSMGSKKLTNVATGTAGTDGVNLGQVELLVAGIGVFQGAYNATTNAPALSGASNVALDLGDYFVVSVAGTAFFSLPLEPGDFIFANNAIAAGSSPNVSNYTVVQADQNIAGAGATDGATQKGVAGFDSANFNVSSNGWVQIKPLSRLNGRKQALNNTSPVTRTFLNNLTTFVIDLADASLFGTGALAEDVTVEVMQNASPFQTVYADVTRSGSASMSIIFSGNVAVDAYRVLLEYV